jgi:hypothetical protein
MTLFGLRPLVGGRRYGPLVKQWELYQHQAAALLRELGFNTEVNAQLTEANGAVHAIDVTARRTVAGVDLLWIVECKLWKNRVPIEKVDALRSRVINLGADRGLLMSESGFQSGAIRTARQKNITLTSLGDLRANAADEILASRAGLAEKRLMDLSLRVNRDLSPAGILAPRMLATFAARIPPEVVEGFAARPEAVEFGAGIEEVWRQAVGITPDDAMAFAVYPHQWWPDVDQRVMTEVATSIQFMTVALYQARLGQWPALCEVREPESTSGRLAWSMAQLINVVEATLPDLEQKVLQQEALAVKRLPASPWSRNSHESEHP